ATIGRIRGHPLRTSFGPLCMKKLRETVKNWDIRSPPREDEPEAAAKFSSLLDRVEYFAEKRWKRYVPAQHADYSPEYLTRLSSWLSNVNDVSDQQLLLEFAACISFFTAEDFCALYQSAFNGPITRWIVARENFNFRM